MRKLVSAGLIVMMAAAGVPSAVAAAAQETATITGIARGTNLQPLKSVRVQMRNATTGEVAGSTLTAETGEFSVPGLPGGSYFVEVLDAANKILGISTPVSVAPGATATASVMALSSAAAAGSGGFSLFGLGPVTSMTVLGAASAAAITGVVSTRADASPSR
jgi:Carboxypeptidase regulatory-like domain